jgi:very-short-patch-repair endonuclease
MGGWRQYEEYHGGGGRSPVRGRSQPLAPREFGLVCPPYRSIAPREASWIPSAYETLGVWQRFVKIHALLVVIVIGAFFLEYREIAWPGAVALGISVASHAAFALFLIAAQDSIFMQARLRRMRAGCYSPTRRRECDSEAERRLEAALRATGISVAAQYYFKNRYERAYWYRADFAFLDNTSGLRLDIEVDGEFKDNDPGLQSKMAKRDRWFTSHGWHVLRFHANDCYEDPYGCAGAVKKYIAEQRLVHLQRLAELGILL